MQSDDDISGSAESWHWRERARAALHEQLQSLWHRLSLSERLVPAEVLEAEEDETERGVQDIAQDSASDVALAPLPEVAHSFQLPWMPPQKSFVPQALAVLALARALATPGAFERLATVGQITVFRYPMAGLEEHAVQTALAAALKLWHFGIRSVTARPEVIVAPSDGEGPVKRSRSGLESFQREVSDALKEGKPVFVIAPHRRVLGDQLGAFCDAEILPPPVDHEVMIELITLLHAEAAAWPLEQLRAALPGDDALRRLSSFSLEVALRDADAAGMIAKLHRHSAPAREAKKSGLVLEDIHGQDEAVEQFLRMIRDLERWKSGDLPWTEVTASAVMFGPPGNGKTSLAQAFAESAGIPLIATSYAECQRHGHQGDMLNALHKVFATAEDSVPAVLFIDEIDSFSTRGAKSDDTYMRGVVNGLLALLSQAASVPGLILLAATNHLSTVDPAVIRPGRFDLRIPVLSPDRDGIHRIILDHLGRGADDDAETGLSDRDLEAAVQEMVGLSGAAVAARAREARSRARDAGRPVRLEDLIPRQRRKGRESGQDLFRVAIHEAGHLVINAMSDLPAATLARISPDSGLVEAHAPAVFTEKVASDYLCFILAGQMAERIVLGEMSSGAGDGPASDLARATLLAIKIETEWGLNAMPQVWQSAEILLARGLPKPMRRRVRWRLKVAMASCRRMLDAERARLIEVADRLLRQRELTSADLDLLLGDLRRGVGRQFMH